MGPFVSVCLRYHMTGNSKRILQSYVVTFASSCNILSLIPRLLEQGKEEEEEEEESLVSTASGSGCITTHEDKFDNV